jgi:KRAB domain-containing zinc finger protein
MQDREQNFVQKMDESSNYSHNDSETDRPNLKRKKPIPDLIPLKYAPSAINLSTNKTDQDDRDVKHEENAEDIQYKIISSLLNKRELSVESIYKPNASGSRYSPETLALKKKNASFFDGLREKLINNSGEAENLICKCNYEAKSLSDLILHQKTCGRSLEKFLSPSSANKGNNLNSTRCQYCRHRCKSSVDLAAHLQNCSEAQSVIECMDSSSDANGEDKNDNQDDYLSDEAPIDNPNERHPMENVVFVWNKIQKNSSENSDQNDDKQNDDSDDNNLIISNDNDEDDLPETPTLKNSEYLGVENAPGYGEITKKIETGDELLNTAMKKVYKCPHCSFWAVSF